MGKSWANSKKVENETNNWAKWRQAATDLLLPFILQSDVQVVLGLKITNSYGSTLG